MIHLFNETDFNQFSAIVYLTYLIVIIHFYSSGKMKLIQTTTGNNANALYYICQIQLIWLSTIITHSFTIRLNLQEFQLCLISKNQILLPLSSILLFDAFVYLIIIQFIMIIISRILLFQRLIQQEPLTRQLKQILIQIPRNAGIVFQPLIIALIKQEEIDFINLTNANNHSKF